MLCTAGSLLTKTTVNLNYFLWWRVVCHDTWFLMSHDQPVLFQHFKTVVGLQSRHRWYVSRAPFPYGKDSLHAILQVGLLPCS